MTENERGELVRELTEEIGHYGVQCAETKILAPTKRLADLLAALSAQPNTQQLLDALSIAQDAIMECLKYPEMPPEVIAQADAAYHVVTKAMDGAGAAPSAESEAAALRERASLKYLPDPPKIEGLDLIAALSKVWGYAYACRDIAVLFAQQAGEPAAMLLYCPRCQKQHIDAPEPESDWTNPPHATHTCGGCGLNWRPSNINTVGVAEIECLEPKHAERIAATAPQPGVREGMLLDALQRAQRVMHGEGVEDQGEAWDKCAQILDEAITRAAEQINAEGRRPEFFCDPAVLNSVVPSAATVSVPMELIDRFPEINPSNYNEDDVTALNTWGIEVFRAAQESGHER